MNILLIGAGGREHALAWKLAQSKHCQQLFIAPGNAGTAQYGLNVNLSPNDFDAIGDFALKQSVDMIVVGPEEPLVLGIWDFFQAHDNLKHIPVFGPSKAGAVLEGSKAWSKAFMERHQIPTASYREFTADTLSEGLKYLSQHSLPIVLKADGLAAGKGVVICKTLREAKKEFQEMLGGKFGQAGAKVVIEQFLTGIEFSVFVITDGKNYCLLPEAKDYKRIGVGDKGPNTGGMGAVSPVPFVDAALWGKVEANIIQPTIDGLKKEKIPYCGFIFFGLILVDNEPFVIEYNCRMGDPETEVVVPRIKNDLVLVLDACLKGKLKRVKIKSDKKAAATIFLVSGGYPGDYEKNKVITGITEIKGSIPFYAGVKESGGNILTNGGRVLALTSYGKDLQAALRKSRRNAKIVDFEGKYFRKDIGKDVL